MQSCIMDDLCDTQFTPLMNVTLHFKIPTVCERVVQGVVPLCFPSLFIQSIYLCVFDGQEVVLSVFFQAKQENFIFFVI